MRILEYFFAALGACLAAFLGYMALAGVSRFSLFPGPYALFFGLAFVYTAFRAWLDRKIAPGRKFPTAAEGVATGAFFCFMIAGVWLGRPHPAPQRMQFTAYQGHTITAASPGTMITLFIEAHEYLLAHGFKPTGQPFIPGVLTTYTASNFTGINYAGSNGDSAPFVLQLEIHSDDNQLVASVGQQGATDEEYKAQVKATKAFLAQFEKALNESENARQGAIAKAAASVEQATADAAPPGGRRPGEVQIAIHKDDSIEVDGVAVPMTSLKEELGKRLAKDGFMVVTLISEPKTNRETTAAVLNVCKALKITGITLTVAEGN